MSHPANLRLPARLQMIIVTLVAPLAAYLAAYLALRFLGLPASNPFEQSYYSPLTIAAMVAATLIGPFFWWRWVLRDETASPGRGIAVGAVVSLVAHPLMWLGATIWASRTGGLLIVSVPVGWQTPQGFVFSILLDTMYSLLYVGWITTIVGAAVGAGLGKLLIRASLIPAQA